VTKENKEVNFEDCLIDFAVRIIKFVIRDSAVTSIVEERF